MKALWAVVVGLALVYVAVWSFTNEDVAEAPATYQEGSREALAELARSDAISRLGSDHTTEIASVAPRRFNPGLDEVVPTETEGKDGYLIEISAKVDNVPAAKLTYHASSPRQVLLKKQEHR